MSKIEAIFAERFAHWKILLPPELVLRGDAGTLSQQGWSIQWVFGEDPEQGRYLDYYATHRMTNDRHCRLYESGVVEDLPAMMDFIIYPEGATEEEEKRIAGRWREENVGIEAEIRRKFPIQAE